MLIALPNAFGDAAHNMAVDASLLSSCPPNTALFRHYGWTEPAITFGYTQKWKSIKEIFPKDLQLCRRSTGGGIVDHRNDWTYSIILSHTLPTSRNPPTKIYQELHRCILEVLKQAQVDCDLAPCPRACDSPNLTLAPNPSQCFLEASANDVLRSDGAKIAGAALKRTRKGLLIQGSILRENLPDTFKYPQFQTNFLAKISQTWAIPIKTPDDLRPYFQRDRIAQEKDRFRSPQWQKKR
ncbi:MAG: Octanoyltransferase LipM [Opitutia bacterium UBA7350]|nr:MAG: Octanoyltransferase LipM [Opitutae bacterium UBA7350]